VVAPETVHDDHEAAGAAELLRYPAEQLDQPPLGLGLGVAQRGERIGAPVFCAACFLATFDRPRAAAFCVACSLATFVASRWSQLLTVVCGTP